MENAILNKPVENSEEVQAAMQRLPDLLGLEHVTLLLELLETIVNGSGYGAVEIVISEKRIQTLKLTQSFKPDLRPQMGRNDK